jgi:hypothetical protein
MSFFLDQFGFEIDQFFFPSQERPWFTLVGGTEDCWMPLAWLASPPIFDASMCGFIIFMQAFTQVFVSTKAHSPTKLACLAAMADMLLPVCNDSVTFFSFTLFAFPIRSTKQGGGP